MKECFLLALSVLFLFSGCAEKSSVAQNETLHASPTEKINSSECDSSYLGCATTEEVVKRINYLYGINDTYEIGYIECDYDIGGGERMTGTGTFADGKTFEFYYEFYGYSASGGHGFETCFSMNSDEKDSRFKSVSYNICRSLSSVTVDNYGKPIFDNTTETVAYCIDGGYDIKDDKGTSISVKQEEARSSAAVEPGSVPCYRGSKVNDIKLFQEACAKAEQLNDKSIICSLVRDKAIQEECLDKLIHETNDSSNCGKMSFGKDYCYEQFSIKNKDLTICGKISNKEQRDNCYIGDFRFHNARPQSGSVSYDGATGKFRSLFFCLLWKGMTIKEIKVSDKLDPQVSCKAIYEPDNKVESEGNFSVDAECSGGTALKNKGDLYELEINIKFHGTLPQIRDIPADYQENGTLMGEAG